VCRHRGGALVAERRGTAGRHLVCPYHGWAYGRDGVLVATSDPEAFPDSAGLALAELPAAERYGLVWVRPSPAAPGRAGTLDMESYLGPLAADFSAFGLERSHLFAPETLAARMNWKLMVDTFLEDYHFRSVHGASVHRLYLDNLAIYEPLGPHVRYVIPKRTIRGLKGRDRASWRLREHSNILYYLFPNTIIVFVADHAALFAVFPSGIDESVMLLSFLVPEPPTSAKARAYWEKNAALIKTALAEDFAVAEGVQRGLASGANTHLTFGRYEPGLAYFHQAVERALAEAGG
ncbi:MAG: SRPBCC family protein, partial [Alphaproteobacteria bacterium]